MSGSFTSRIIASKNSFLTASVQPLPVPVVKTESDQAADILIDDALGRQGNDNEE